MKILVTGGAGFIASHIADKYIELGHSVIVVDNLLSGRKENLNPKAKFFNIDIRDREKLLSLFLEERPEVVNHHAAVVSVNLSMNDPKITEEVNVLGTKNVLDAAVESGAKKIIFASTGGAFYGDLIDRPFTEDDPANPKSPYGKTKLEGEKIIREVCENSSLSYTIFRYANIFGPRQDSSKESGVFAVFCDLMRQGKRPTIFNKEATRDYVYVADVVEANALALDKGKNRIYNIGTGVQTENQKVFELVAREYGYAGDPIYKPARGGEVLKTALDASRAKKELGWEPKVDLKTGIRLIHAWQN